MANTIPDPWSTAPVGATGQYSNILPSAADKGAGFQERLLNRLRGAKQAVATAAPGVAASVGAAPLGRYTTLGTAGLMGAQQLAQGNPLGAVAEAGGGLLGGAAVTGLAGKVAGALPGPLGAVARIGIPLAGSIFGGQLAGGLVGAAKAETEKPTAEPLYIPGTTIPLNQSAQYENVRNRDLAYQLRASKASGEQELQLNRQYMADARNDEILRQKAMLPLQEQINRSNLVNAQAMLASQTAAYQQLGRTAGMFKLAQGAQAETGATLRTAISQNPYIGATLSAPSISFG